MHKISINIVGWKHPHEVLKRCMDSVLAQDFNDFELWLSDNAAGENCIGRNIEFCKLHYGNDPKVKIIDNKKNIGYAGGHNKFFEATDSELVMVLNPDADMQPGFLKNIITAFDDPKVAAATGKMLKMETNVSGEKVLDGTGIIVSKARAVRERGQLQIDRGQYDNKPDIFGVSGSAAVYRRSALENVKILDNEYFDPDFIAYYEDLDLSYRFRLMGYSIKYVAEAVILHERAAGKSPGGYKRPITFIKHYRAMPSHILKFSARNHLFAMIKNEFGWSFWQSSPLIFGRNLAYFGFLLIFRPIVFFRAWQEFFQLLPKMLKKRKIIQARKKVSSQDMQKWFK
jgi:GT2 family glycosyltransferase